MRRETAPTRNKPEPFVAQKAPPQRNLDYTIVKIDTLPFSRPAPPTGGASVTAVSPEPSSAAKVSPSPKKRTAQREYVAPPSSGSTRFDGGGSYGGGGNMIVVSTLDSRGGAGGYGRFSGGQTLRLKVILPAKISVTNGSLVEARVMQDETWNGMEIPRRSILFGVCNLQNNRVHIEFNELRIRGVSHSCNGRAYDLKSVPGIPYSPFSAEAEKAVLDELKGAAAGVPVVGRYLNQSSVNSITDEKTTLDEGLEFYVLVANIF
jgi:hypothetical protein